MKIEEYYNLRLRRAIPQYFKKLGFDQWIVNIKDKDERQGTNQFKFIFHPSKDNKAHTFAFYIDFLLEDKERAIKAMNKDEFANVILKSIRPYGDSISINEDCKAYSDVHTIRILIKFDPDSWEFINSWRLR